MTKSADNLRFYGDLDSGVWRADKGSTLPTDDFDPPGVDFDEVGWLDDNGMPFDRDTDTQEVNAYQATKLLRSKTTLKKETIKFNALEENLVVMGIAYPGATITSAATGVAKIEPSGSVNDNACWVVDMIDGTSIKRYCVSDGDASVSGTLEHKSTDPTIYEITLTMNEYYILTSNPAILAAVES